MKPVEMPRRSRFRATFLATVTFPLIILGILGMTILVGASTGSSSETGSGRSFRYRISSRGFTVGDLHTVFSPARYGGSPAVRFTSDLEVEARLIFFKKRSRSHEEALVTGCGTVRYRRKGEENGRNSTVEAELEGDRFRFRIEEDGAWRSVEVPRGSFDFTTMDCPETSLKQVGETREVRLLDMERATVVTRSFRLVKTEEVEVSGRKIHCKVVDFSDPNNRCRRWVTNDERGVIIVRQDGSGKNGTYSLRLVALTEHS